MTDPTPRQLLSAIESVPMPSRGIRRLVAAMAWPGVHDDDALKVTPRAAGANMSVDVAPGIAVVDGGPERGGVAVELMGITNVAVDPAPGAGEERIDLLVAQVVDPTYDDDGTPGWSPVVIAGDPDPSPDPPAVPYNALLLAEILVTDDTVSIGAGAITDQRGPTLPASTWPVLPATGTDGQLVTLPDGELYKRIDGDWVRHLARSDFRTVSATTLLQLAPRTAGDIWAAAITVPGGTPAGKVVVDVSWWYPIGDEIYGETYFEVSGDGGVTWLAGPQMAAGNNRAWKVTITPTGEVMARVKWAANVAGSPPDHAADAGATFTATIMPVT